MRMGERHRERARERASEREGKRERERAVHGAEFQPKQVKRRLRPISLLNSDVRCRETVLNLHFSSFYLQSNHLF